MRFSPFKYPILLLRSLVGWFDPAHRNRRSSSSPLRLHSARSTRTERRRPPSSSSTSTAERTLPSPCSVRPQTESRPASPLLPLRPNLKVTLLPSAPSQTAKEEAVGSSCYRKLFPSASDPSYRSICSSCGPLRARGEPQGSASFVPLCPSLLHLRRAEQPKPSPLWLFFSVDTANRAHLYRPFLFLFGLHRPTEFPCRLRTAACTVPSRHVLPSVFLTFETLLLFCDSSISCYCADGSHNSRT